MSLTVRLHDDLDDLVRDLAGIPPRAVRDMRATVRSALVFGNAAARSNARRTSGTHGGPPNGHYVQAITWEMHSVRGGFGAYAISGEFGPDSAKKQGNMSFEGGSKNQPPHHDLLRAGEATGPILASAAHRLPDGWFWS